MLQCNFLIYRSRCKCNTWKHSFICLFRKNACAGDKSAWGTNRLLGNRKENSIQTRLFFCWELETGRKAVFAWVAICSGEKVKSPGSKVAEDMILFAHIEIAWAKKRETGLLTGLLIDEEQRKTRCSTWNVPKDQWPTRSKDHLLWNEQSCPRIPW